MSNHIDLRKSGEQGATGIIIAKDNQHEQSYWFTVGHAAPAIRQIEREWDTTGGLHQLGWLTAKDKGLLLLSASPEARMPDGSSAYLSLAIARAPMREMAGQWLGEDLKKIGEE